MANFGRGKSELNWGERKKAACQQSGDVYCSKMVLTVFC